MCDRNRRSVCLWAQVTGAQWGGGHASSDNLRMTVFVTELLMGIIEMSPEAKPYVLRAVAVNGNQKYIAIVIFYLFTFFKPMLVSGGVGRTLFFNKK